MINTAFGDIEWGDTRSLWQWLQAHDIKHQALTQAVERQGTALPAFLLAESIDDSWVQIHYQQHVTLSQFVGFNADSSIYNLLTDPMDDEDTFYDWMDIHDLIHQQLDQAFGIT